MHPCVYEYMDAFSLHELQEQLKLFSIFLFILTKFKVVKCGRTCMVCDQPKSVRTHAHRTHIFAVFSHAHAHVRPHIAHVRARTHLRNSYLAYHSSELCHELKFTK